MDILDKRNVIFLFFLFYTLAEAASNVLVIKNRPLQPYNTRTPQFKMTKLKGDLTSDTFSLFKNLTGLEIEWCAIHDLEPATFRKTHLEILEIHNNIEFPTISSSTFEYLENLKVFRFNFNPYTEIEDGAFTNLKKLDVLSISHQNMPNLTVEFLEGLENLKELALTYNELETVEKNAFRHMTELTAVYLGHNKIKTIEFGTFKHQRKLEDLQLQSNQLGNEENLFVMNWDKFDRILTLRYFNIAENGLAYINVQKLLTNFPVLESINFMPNNFTCSNELYITRMLRHYRVQLEYYGNTKSACKDLDFERIGVTVFSVYV